MDQREKRVYLIQQLINEKKEYRTIPIPDEEEEQKKLLRSLMNIRSPHAVSQDFLTVQDSYLQQENAKKGIVTIEDMTEMQKDIFLWRGDITRIQAGAIVNAANSTMTGCYQPCHNCIDNCIHTYAGVELRNACDALMQKQGHEEETGQAKITLAYNLPCEYVIHTVGPIVQGRLTKGHQRQLESCYRSCLLLADQYHLESIAFCCISTGVFCFPDKKAAQIAIQTVKEYQEKTKSELKVIFNVYLEKDERIYEQLLR